MTIYVINSENSQDETLQQTLKSYAELSDHIKLVYKDPVVSPDFYKVLYRQHFRKLHDRGIRTAI